MRIVDCHVHMGGKDLAPAEIIKQMDATGVARTLVFSQQERVSLQQTRAQLLRTKKIIEYAPSRLSGLAWVNPLIPGMAGLAEEALTDMGYSGIKIIPDHWYVYEERLEPFWERMHALRAGILFHTGILYGNDDGSRFCHPVYLEKLLHYPHIRFAMAHVSWPWCEECLAVMGRMRAATEGTDSPWQSYVDLTPGTPSHIRKQAVANAISFCGPERIMFGTDCTLENLRRQKEHIERDLALLDELGVDKRQQKRIMAGTADEVFPARK